jgi:splicing factor 3A subunit 1
MCAAADTVFSNKPVGIIIPPVEIRSNCLIMHFLSLIEIADKTAEFVAKNGSTFETILLKTEANNPKFGFLKETDPYRSYYEQKIAEFAMGIGMNSYFKLSECRNVLKPQII